MGGERVKAVIAGLALLASGSCCAHNIKAFDVEPHAVCPGETVQVTWDVKGPARLRAERGTTDWDEGDVPPTGSRTVIPAVTTTLKLKALRANPGEPGAFDTKYITVLPSGRKQASATCDAAGHCRATFKLNAPGGQLQARKLSSPQSRQDGALTPTKICASHAGLPAPVCIESNQSADVAVAADGEWILEADIPGAVPPAPPPDLMVEMQLGCH